MDTALDEARKEALLREIIAERSDAVSYYLNDIFDGPEGEGEQAGYGDLMPVQEEEHEDGSGDPMPVQGDRDDGSGDRTESGQVYILVKPVLTS